MVRCVAKNTNTEVHLLLNKRDVVGLSRMLFWHIFREEK